MRLLIFFIAALYYPSTAYAYVGPGLGLGAIGAILGVCFSILLAIVGVFWYPLKRLFGIGKKKKNNDE